MQQAFFDAYMAGDVDALVDLYAEDARYYPVDAMAVQGREAIREVMAPFFDAYTVQDGSITEHCSEAMGDEGELGLVDADDRPKEGGDPITLEGRYMDLAKTIDGRWVYVMNHDSVPMSAEWKAGRPEEPPEPQGRGWASPPPMLSSSVARAPSPRPGEETAEAWSAKRTQRS